MASTEDNAHASSLEYTLKQLQRQIRTHEQELQRLRTTQTEAALSPIAQVQVITAALDEITNTEPFLPFPESVLPSLLAMRKTYAVITESNAFVEEQVASLEAENRQLEADRAALKDHNLMHEALTARMKSLEQELSTSADVGYDEAVNEKKEELERKARDYHQRRRQLMRDLVEFMEHELAPLLVAEEMGGPVVGDLMDVDARDLAAGFTDQGKLRKTGKSGGTGRERGQQRIDEIWSNVPRDSDGRRREQSRGDQRRRPLDDVEAAAAEMRWVVEQLLNQLGRAAGNTEDSYVTISRESAAIRFLIRSKVAQYHPRDISRIKLIDFGRELEE